MIFVFIKNFLNLEFSLIIDILVLYLSKFLAILLTISLLPLSFPMNTMSEVILKLLLFI